MTTMIARRSNSSSVSRRSSAPFSLSKAFFLPSVALPLLIAILFCILSSTAQARAVVDADTNEWFGRDARAPKPKFIRFGRAGQKLIRFGRSSAATNDEAYNDNLDAMINEVNELYPPAVNSQEFSGMASAFQPALKRAQKLIRFG